MQLEAKVVEFDPKRGDLKLSIKALREDSERNAYQQYRQQVSREAKFGTFGDLLAKKGLTTKDAIKNVARALAMAMRRSAATGDGMIIAAITKAGYTEYSGKELEKVLGAK